LLVLKFDTERRVGNRRDEMGKVVGIKGPAQDPDAVLENAKGEFESVMVIGWDKDEMLDVRAILDLNQQQCLWLIEKFKFNMLRGEYADD
jgi:hypothetical protein